MTKTVFVMSNGGGGSSGGGGCPRLLVDNTKTVIKDDYYGRVKIAKAILSKISSL